jgi:peptide/nickel transport system permease protein
MQGSRAVVLPGVGAPTRRRSSAGFYMKTFRRLLRSPSGLFGLIVMVLLVLTALLAPLIATHDPLAQHPGAELSVPSSRYLVGTDEFGRDIFSRIVYGSRISLFVGVLAVAIGGLVGVSSGLAAGYFGGWLDASIMRVWDALLAFPAILLGIAVATVLGPGVTNAAVALAIVSIPQFSRITRASVLGEKQREYVQAARCLGAGDVRVALRHIFPNTVSPLLVQLSLAMAYAVLAGGGALVPRPRHAAARPILGLDAQHQPRLPPPGALVRGLPGAGADGPAARAELPLRRPPRCPGSEADASSVAPRPSPQAPSPSGRGGSRLAHARGTDWESPCLRGVLTSPTACATPTDGRDDGREPVLAYQFDAWEVIEKRPGRSSPQ